MLFDRLTSNKSEKWQLFARHRLWTQPDLPAETDASLHYETSRTRKTTTTAPTIDMINPAG
jgi:hypothetical protein